MISALGYEPDSALAVANREFETVISAVAHELRSPLRQIEGYLDLLRSELEPQIRGAAVDVYLNTLDRTAARMSAQFDALLSFSRIGHQEMLRTSVSMKSLVDEVKHQLEAASAPGTIEWIIGDRPPACGDAAMSHIVVSNLLGNAVKFSKHRHPARIRIDGAIHGNEVRYVISDNGAGFDMKRAGRLFNVFQRLHTREEFEGHGIGLALVRRIILKHGGWIRAFSTTDRGAEFTFALPVDNGC